jgi:type IV pilus assembly protein PilX
MNARHHAASSRQLPLAQRGFVLVASLLMLVVVTLLAVTMFRSFGVDEKIAGNSRDKEMAVEAAQSSEQYAENWLVNAAANADSTNVAAVNCTALVASTVGQVCSNPMANPSSLPWTAGVTYALPTPSTVLSATPEFYIYSLGSSGLGNMYLIDSVAYGASTNTVAEVEAYYQLLCTNAPC